MNQREKNCRKIMGDSFKLVAQGIRPSLGRARRKHLGTCSLCIRNMKNLLLQVLLNKPVENVELRAPTRTTLH